MMKKAQDPKEKTENKPEKVTEKSVAKSEKIVEKPTGKSDDLEKSPTLSTKKKSKKPLIITITIIVLLAGVCAWFLLTGAFDLKTGTFDFNKLFGTKQETASENASDESIENSVEPEKIYSRLTGLEIADAKINNLPVYCIQIPNDTYGARPQIGLSHAAILFEAIAEGGITRFATVYQNFDDSVIGPIRSLRTYYLDWETPFDCTLVHAGGEEEARKTAANGTYRDLTESVVYMYRDSRGYTAPDNLFTSTALLTKFNSDKNYTSSSPKVFPRQTPLESENIAKIVRENATRETASGTAETTSGTNQATSEITSGELVPVSSFKINFNKNAKNSNFNTVYEYNEKTNSYDRSFQSGAEHLVYNCRAGLEKPSPKQDCGEPVQLSPNVVVAMMVDEYTKSNTRESIQTIGSGDATIFQNGSVIKARWSKGSKSEQITFLDKDGEVIKLAPGQLLIAAVPNAYGSVEY